METFTKEQLMAAVQYAMEYQQGVDYQRVGALDDSSAKILDQLDFNTAPVEPLTFEEIQEHLESVKP